MIDWATDSPARARLVVEAILAMAPEQRQQSWLVRLDAEAPASGHARQA